MSKKLVYISNNVINHSGNETALFFQEKFFLLERFGVFNVVSTKGIYKCHADGSLIKEDSVSLKDVILSHIKAIFDIECYKEIFHMLKDKKFSLSVIAKIIYFSGQAILLEKLIKKSAGDLGSDMVLYSYWMSVDAYATARIKHCNPQITAIARAHSFEVQLQRNAANPYLMKRFICDNMDKVAFISKNSLDEFTSYYKGKSDNFYICHIGSSSVNSEHIVRKKRDKLTIASCSSVIPIKQLDVIIEALADWKLCPIKWIHIGKGSSMCETEELAKSRLTGDMIEYEFLGGIPNNEVFDILKRDDVDVFVNSSKAEGIPVSIMEAMSVGLPIVAPKINGIPELVKQGCGYLYEAGSGAQGLTEKLKRFALLSEAERLLMGKSAYEQWKAHFCLEDNDINLFEGV